VTVNIDPSELSPEDCRRGEWACCREDNAAGGSTEADHWFLMHSPTLPGRGSPVGGMLIEHIGDEDSSMLIRLHGRVLRWQTGPFSNSWDALVEDVFDSESQYAVVLSSAPRDGAAPRVQEILGSYDGARVFAAVIQRADPLYKDLPCSRRWPLPDIGRPVMVLTASVNSAGWRDLGALHHLATLEHRYVLVESPSATRKRLVYFLEEVASSPERWGGVLISRGGGDDWREGLDHPDVLRAAAAVRSAFVTVMTGLGHEADVPELERAADFAWSTPSRAGDALARLARFANAAKEHDDEEGLPDGVFHDGVGVRKEFDAAWRRAKRSKFRLLRPWSES
jgi:hypothetical protein